MPTASKPTQTQIQNAVWSACDSLRGTLDPTLYKDYVLALLFFKYVSDVYSERREKIEEQYENPELVNRKLERERFFIPEGRTFDDILEARLEDENADLGDLINKALAAIERNNPKKLEHVFRDVDFASPANLGEKKDRNRRLRNLIDAFDTERLNFRAFADDPDGDDIIGDAYLYLIERFASDAGKKGGEFYTPIEVSKIMAQIVDPQPGDRIYDPTIGSASLAITAADQVRKKHDSDNVIIYGQEANRMTWALAKMNLFLHRIDNAVVKRGDTINEPKLKEGDRLMSFDVVVANPPFSLKNWGKEAAKSDEWERFDRGVPPKNRGDYAFILHMLHSAREDSGRVASVVPHGVLFRGGAEKRIRRSLVQDNLLDAVIGLPENLFAGTGIPAAIMVFRKDRDAKERDDVLFIDASETYEDATGKNKLRKEDIDRIVSAYRAREEVDKFAYVANRAEIKENDYNLNIPRYVDTFEPEEPVDLEKVQKEIREIQSELDRTRADIDEQLAALNLP